MIVGGPSAECSSNDTVVDYEGMTILHPKDLRGKRQKTVATVSRGDRPSNLRGDRNKFVVGHLLDGDCRETLSDWLEARNAERLFGRPLQTANDAEVGYGPADG
jgi:hypothetical protein